MASTVMTAKSAVGYMVSSAAQQRRPHTPYGLAHEDCDSCQASPETSFCALSPRAAHSLSTIRRTSSYPAGAILFMEGEQARGVYIVCQGRVKLLTTNSDGKTLIFKIAKPGEILGLNAALSGTPHEITAETLQPAQLAYVSREDFLKFIRENKVKTKFNTVKGVLRNKVVVIVDDSIVRGTTSRQLVQLVRQAGPKEVHFRVTSPPIMHPCYYGMDFPTPKELIANKCGGDIEKIGRELGVDSIGYLTIEDLLESAPREHGEHYCTACFSGRYPVPIDANQSKEEHEA